MVSPVEALQRPLGPLPVWAWGTLGGGVILLIMARNGHPSASALLNPNAPAPAAPGDSTNQQPGVTTPNAPAQPVSILPPGSSVYDPNTGKTSPGVTIADLLGGQSLTDVINRLGPDYQQFSLVDNGLGATVTHAAQNVLDTEANIAHDTNFYDAYGRIQAAQIAASGAYAIAHDTNAFANLTAQQQAYYGYLTTGNTNAWANQTATTQAAYGNNTANTAAYYDYLSRLSTTQNNAGVTTTPNIPASTAPSPAPAPSCPQGNYSCIRSYCTSGNNSCAQAVAPWFNPARDRF